MTEFKEYIYVIRCGEDKYYVGKTNSPEKRLEAHQKSYGSEWTKIHRPAGLVELIENDDSFLENKKTKEYMLKFGIDNVRGGAYSMINLPDYQKKSLEAEFKSIKNTCYKCDSDDHFSKDCDKSTIKKIINKLNQERKSHIQLQKYEIDLTYIKDSLNYDHKEWTHIDDLMESLSKSCKYNNSTRPDELAKDKFDIKSLLIEISEDFKDLHEKFRYRIIINCFKAVFPEEYEELEVNNFDDINNGLAYTRVKYYSRRLNQKLEYLRNTYHQKDNIPKVLKYIFDKLADTNFIIGKNSSIHSPCIIDKKLIGLV
jgi:predicted GIY-YIG superfamily endonuclease